MTKLEKIQVLQRLQDVAQKVIVSGKIETAPFSPKIISIICDMELQGAIWKLTIQKEIEKLGGTDAMY